MKHWFSIFFVGVFLFWLIPLGVFIAPSQEKMACNGQRAICLCSNIAPLISHNQSYPNVVKIHPRTENREMAVSIGNFFDAVDRVSLKDQSAWQYFSRNSFNYSLLLPKFIDHVPKV